jgi:biotin synthase
MTGMAATAEQVTGIAPAWTAGRVLALMELPFPDLLFRAQEVHRRHFDPRRIQLSALLSIKTGACPEDCAYCPQSARYDTGLQSEKLLPVEEIVRAAKEAHAGGATRFCMGAAWRGPKERDLAHVVQAIRGVRALGMETCATLGMLSADQALRLKAAGLDYYNHNVDTSEEFYEEIITTHGYRDRIATLETVRKAGLKVCCGGIVGMGESRADRAAMIAALAAFTPPPESVPINSLVPTPGTPLAQRPATDPFEFVRTVAAARIALPQSHVRLSAGRAQMSDELQALCFLAGANSIFYGDRLLTAANAAVERDRALFERLDLRAESDDERCARL